MDRVRGFEFVAPEHQETAEYLFDKSFLKLPERATAHSAGYDFVAPYAASIEPGEKHLYWTDVKAYMRPGELLILNVRSSGGIKKNLQLSNTTGWVDADYYGNPDNDGNIGISLRNIGSETIFIQAGEKIAQGAFIPFLVADTGNVDQARLGGIGSTDREG